MVPSETKGLRKYHDFDVYGNYENDRDELNANIWSAEYQLGDDEVMDVLQDEIGFFEAAKRLRVAAALLDFKFRSMNARGYLLNSPIYAHKNYMDKSL